ncbi:hypothetical protein H1R20_g14270, partial [Candolleomyces eurysporus]
MDNSLDHLHGSNAVPSNIELQRLKDLLAPDEIALSRLEEEIKQAGEVLQTLAKEKKAIEDRVRPLKALSSLIRQIPAEIMQEIFMHSRPSSYSRTSGICDAPLLLLRVCRSWRDLALSTPQLWASVEVAMPKHLSMSDAFTEGKMNIYTAEIRRWIARSGDAPLSLRIRQDYYIEGHDNFFVSIFQDYLKHSARLVSIELRVKREVLEAITSAIDAHSLEGLSTVRIWDASYDLPGEIFASSNLFKAKNLKKFHFVPSYCPAFEDLPLDWSNLTSLSIGASQTSRSFFPGDFDEAPFSATESISILRRTPRLVSCTLMLPSSVAQRPQWTQENEDREDCAAVMLQDLETLRITGPDEELATIIKQIETPRIRNFTYHPWIALNRSPTPAFRSSPLLDFFDRYGEIVESMSVDLLDITDDDFIACLQRIPAVKDLYLGPTQTSSSYYHPLTAEVRGRSIPFTDVHLALLTLKPHPLCPRLENLECAMPARLTQDAICSFLDARSDAKNIASGVSRIQRLSFSSMQLDFPLTEFLENTFRYREELVRLHFWKDMHNLPTFVAPMGALNTRPTPWTDDL